MIGKAIAGVAGLLVGSVVLCAVAVGALFVSGGEAGAGCVPAGPAVSVSPITPPPGGGYPAIGRWTGEQVANAAVIARVGAQRGVPARGWVIAVATAMQESSLVNLAGGDRDSVGLFQQRPSQGWGTPDQLRDPGYASGKFYDALLAVPGWQSLPLTEAAQRVQRSAYPDAYSKWEADAITVVSTLTGVVGGALSCVGPRGWVAPTKGVVVSGFRTPERPAHEGVDLAVPKRTTIRAASSGLVTQVRCNASRGGEPYSCDVDGSADVQGCGWYVDVAHAGDIVTRYCHLLTQPIVHIGQSVVAGQPIGVSGTSGNSSGPHLHFEVRLAGAATDPVVFMAARAAPLGQ